MCGIFGIWNLDGATVDKKSVEVARDTMMHRGPDDTGIFVDGALALAHRRLSILDLSAAGHMPMWSQDQRCLAVFNGEIYNCAELRSDLQHRGIHFRGHGDSEVVVNAYAQWGMDCFERFNGMFAIGVWDKERRQLVLARDPMGEKPLYFHWLPTKRLIFASSLKACWALAPDLKRIDPQGIANYLRFGYTFDDQSLSAGIQKVHPGTALEFSAANECQATIYFDLATEALASAQTSKRSAHAYEEELDALLYDAVRMRMTADVPLGAFLSGGIDSSLVVAQMARAAKGSVRTFTMGFDEPAFDESAAAQRIAKHFGVSSQSQKLSASGIFSEIGRVVHYFDEPVADYSALPSAALSAFARQHVTVALSGDGADELFAGYKYYIAQRAFEQYAQFTTPALREKLARLSAFIPHQGLMRTVARSTASDPATYFARCGFYRGAIDRKQALELMPDVPAAEDAVSQYLRDAGFQTILEAGLLFDARFTLPNAWLHKLDRASMACSLEVRAPFLDPRVVRFAFALPLDMRLHGTTKKHLLRRVLKRHLPSKLFERPKQGFTAPMAQWLRGPLQSELARICTAENISRLQGVDIKTVERMRAEHQSGAKDHAQILWAILTLHWWLEHHVDAHDLRAHFSRLSSAAF